MKLYYIEIEYRPRLATTNICLYCNKGMDDSKASLPVGLGGNRNKAFVAPIDADAGGCTPPLPSLASMPLATLPEAFYRTIISSIPKLAFILYTRKFSVIL